MTAGTRESGPVGGDARRVDALERVTGRARYAADLRPAGLLHGAVLRSPHHHARLLAVGTAPALDVPGVLRALTAADVPGVNGFPEYSRDEPLLPAPGETLKSLGAPVALVVAESAPAAQAGLRALQVRYEVLPHRMEVDPGGAPIYPGGDRLAEHRVTLAQVEPALEACDLVVEARYATAFQEHAALEPEAVLAYPDEHGGVTVLGGTHEPHWQARWIAAVLAMPEQRVRFITPPTGGSFGGKQDPWPLAACALMAHLAGRPVQLVYSRRESFLASPKRHPYRLHYRVGARRDGRLAALQARIQANTGAYDSAGYYIPEYAVMASGGPYRWEAVDLHAESVYSNAPKAGQFRGFGTPQATFALECALDEVAEALEVDPIDLRLQNAIRQGEPTFLGYPVAETLGYREVLEALRPRYARAVERARAFNAGRRGAPLRAGVGVAGMWYRFGKSGSRRIEAHAELAPGGEIVIYCSAPDYGQGISTVMLQLAAHALGVPRDGLRLINADTALVPDSDVQGASRATYWVGNAVLQAASALHAAILGAAGELLDRDPGALRLGAGEVADGERPGVRVSLAELARELERQGTPRRVRGTFDLSAEFPPGRSPAYTPHFVTGAHLAEVRVDLETGQVRVSGYTAVHDVGRVINRAGAEGQVEGAVVMGLGAALSEAYLPGSTTGLSDYILPLVGEIPEIEVVLVEVPGERGPLGAKGLGETAMLPSTPAIVNAVSRAIGARVREIPAIPQRVLEAARGAARPFEPGRQTHQTGGNR